MKLPITNTEQETRDYNLPIYGQTGEYSLSANVRVPYFISLIDLKRVTEELKTHEEVSPSLDNSYNLVELFQRNIDPERVRKEIVEGYLKNPNKLKFFNSLTIVLLPKDESGKTSACFSDYDNNNPKVPYQDGNEFDAFFNQDSANREIFGGVQFIRTEAASLSRLRWDRRRVDAVAVDGQHRLKALKLWMDQNNNELGETARSTRIPIIFLLLHERAGFKSSSSASSGIKTIAREIFTDLNKNAREVDLATQIILDDRSLSSCCVRSLITESTCQDHDKLLPLSLLRWQDANNRFDQKYFLNSLVNLHLMIEDLLSLEPPVKDPMNKTKATSYLKSAIQRVGMNNSEGKKDIIVDGTSLLDFYENKFIDEETGDPKTPLTNIPVQFLDEAVKGFKENFSSWMLTLLREFKPYRDLLEYARSQSLITGDFARYLAQPREHREQLATDLQAQHGENWEDVVINKHSRQIENIKGLREDEGLGEQWAFKTIFQKAYMRVGKTLFFDIPEDEIDKFGNTDDFISFMNTLYSSEVLRVKAPLPGKTYDLWTFIALNYGSGKIKVASTSESRIQAILILCYYISRMAKEENKAIGDEDNESTLTVASALKTFSTKKASTDWPNCYDHYQSLMKEFTKAADIIQGIADSGDLSDQERKSIAKTRTLAVAKEVLKAFHEPLGI
jgi:hypothetical protein